MGIKKYKLLDNRIEFYIKKVNSSKQGRFIGLLIFLFCNYLFIFALFGYNNYYRSFAIYIIFSIITGIMTFKIASSSMKRYNSIIKELDIQSDRIIQIDLISGENIILKVENFHITNDILVIDRKTKFEELIIEVAENQFLLIPDWFKDSEEIKNQLNLYR